MKSHSKFKKLMLGALLIGCTSFTTANAVVIELALVIDGSGSISGPNFSLQTQAYNNIFSNSFVSTFVNPADSLYVSAFQFSDNIVQEIGWTLLSNDMAAAAFGGMFPGITQRGSTTNTALGVNTAAASIAGNGIDGDRLIIDVSTDGLPNRPGGSATGTAAALTAATNAAADGITVNAIGVGAGVTGSSFLGDFSSAGGGFFLTADNFTDFEGVLRTNISREIMDPPTSVPEPTSMLLLGIGMIGLTAARKKKMI